MEIRKYLEENILLFDGAMGTYFSTIYEEPLYKCEYGNITSPKTIQEIHRRYLKAGAKAIKTNTFASYSESGDAEFSYGQIIQKGYAIAEEVAKQYDAYVFCDIGPIQVTHEVHLQDIYRKIVDEFIALGGKYFLFETFLDDRGLNEIARYIKERVADAYIIVSFAIAPDGYTKAGIWGRELLENACDEIDAVGFNCVCGPHHMKEHIQQSQHLKKPIITMPNASYPTVLGKRVQYENNPQYFAKQMMENVAQGARIIGGCCGTTPHFIGEMYKELLQYHLADEDMDRSDEMAKKVILQEEPIAKNEFYRKLTSGSKPIAVELDSPMNTQIEEFLKGATVLRDVGVDIITIADCPIARARMDSSLLACKLKRELQVEVLPHMTCRDRNINASKALLLGLNMEGIHNVLVVTGDPIPSEQRGEVKSVYEFNSRMLIHHINELNHSLFQSPFYVHAALNINARNFHVQLRLAQQKVERGAMAFFTQPVLSEQAIENLKLAKSELKVPILGGILPIVSERNANFINHEIPGISVSDEIVEQYKDKSREECTELAVKISSDIAEKIKKFVDGYYIITPFKRVDIVAQIINNINS